MKNVFIAILVASLLSGCAGRTRYGECVGIFSSQNPRYDYKLSKWNLLVTAIFVETVIVPIFYIADDAVCPYRPKPAGQLEYRPQP